MKSDGSGLILLIAARPQETQIIESVLVEAGYAVKRFSDGAQMTSELDRQETSLVIIDFTVEPKAAMGLLRELRSRPQRVPALACVSESDDEQLPELYGIGIDGLLRTPLQAGDIIYQVFRALLPPDRRWIQRTSRIPVDCALEIKLRTEPVADTINARLANVGAGGCFVAWDQFEVFPEIDQRIQLEIRPKGLRAVGRVRWLRRRPESSAKPAGFGVEWESVSPEVSEEIERLMADEARLLDEIPLGLREDQD